MRRRNGETDGRSIGGERGKRGVNERDGGKHGCRRASDVINDTICGKGRQKGMLDVRIV